EVVGRYPIRRDTTCQRSTECGGTSADIGEEGVIRRQIAAQGRRVGGASSNRCRQCDAHHKLIYHMNYRPLRRTPKTPQVIYPSIKPACLDPFGLLRVI